MSDMKAATRDINSDSDALLLTVCAKLCQTFAYFDLSFNFHDALRRRQY